MIKMINKECYEDIIKENEKLILMDFFAQWCMPCKMFSPVFEKVSEEYTDIGFYKVDIDENQELVNQYSIDSVPTLLFIKNGIVINQEIGFRSEIELKQLIEKYKN